MTTAMAMEKGSVKVFDRHLTWKTASGVPKGVSFSRWDAKFIDERSGLPGRGRNREIAGALGIPVGALVAYQKKNGINVGKREKAYRQAIRRALLITRELGFPIDESPGVVPIDPRDLLNILP